MNQVAKNTPLHQNDHCEEIALQAPADLPCGILLKAPNLQLSGIHAARLSINCGNPQTLLATALFNLGPQLMDNLTDPNHCHLHDLAVQYALLVNYRIL